MRIEKADSSAKGWYLGSWNSGLNISIGFANEGVNDPHVHLRMTEIYLIARGVAEMRVETRALTLYENDVLIVEPGEAHTFTASSPDHFHFVLQIPSLQGLEAKADKQPVPLSRLGLPD